jgi:hypothetical protein
VIRRRHLLYLLAALAVPIPAFGLGSSHQQSLDVGVALDQCGIASTAVVCKLDATFNTIDGGRYYTAAVTGPDGSVVDYGNVSPGATSLWVPYVGDGTYTVTVSAWGRIAGDRKPKPLATDSAGTGHGNGNTTGTPGASGGRGHSHTAATHAASPSHVGSDGSGAADEPTSPADPGPPTCKPDPAEPAPPTPEPPADPADPPTVDDGTADPAIAGVDSSAQKSMMASGQLPTQYTPASDCPDPVKTPDGPCCPDLAK